MPEWGVALVAVACAVGIVGTVVPVLPGSVLIGAAVIVWALVEGPWAPWVAAVAAVAILAAGALLKYLVPGRRLTAAGVPRSTLIVGAVAGIVGFFVIPVIGVVVGFVGGVLVVEFVRLRRLDDAWAATWEAMKASGLSVLIELTAALCATAVWVAAVVAT